VSDVRAATTTQAAQIAAPSADELLVEVASLLTELRDAAQIKVETYRTGLANMLSRPVYRRPLDRINNLRMNIDSLTGRAGRAAWQHVRIMKHQVEGMLSRLESLDPTTILARGYSLAFERGTGKLISRTGQGKAGMPVDLRVSDGSIKMKVEEET
jgi:exodeoxyribonuclease VII large subunit